MIDTKALRSRILDLAIQGKLTNRDISDDSIESLLKEVSEEKKLLISQKIIKKGKGKSLDSSEIPFSIPKEWRLVYLDDIAFVTKLAGFEYTNTIAPNLSKNGIPLFKGKNIQDGRIILEFESYIPQSVSDELPRSQISKKCLLTPYVGTIGNIAIFNGEFKAHLGSNVGKIELLNNESTHILEEYILYYLRSSVGNKQLSKYRKATAQDSISIEAIRNTIVVLPPLAEQKRIVQRVEEIFKLLDTIDEAQEKYSADTEILKAKLITAGIQGKLTQQLPSDGTAEELYQQIQAEKQKLISEGKIKKEKPLPPIADEEIPFEIPSNWKWCKLSEIVSIIGGYAYKSSDFIEKSDNQVLRLGNVKNDELRLSTKPVFINNELAKETDDFKCQINDILITMTGTRFKRDYFFSVRILSDTPALYINQRVGCLRAFEPSIAHWLTWALKSEPILSQVFQYETGSANQGNLGSENIKKVIVPLPPLAEQKRIAETLKKVLGALN